MSSRWRKCFLCDCRENLSFHSFPKNMALKQAWIDACELNARDDVSNIYICTAHFTESDVLQHISKGAMIYRLNPAAIPKNSLKGQKCKNTYPQKDGMVERHRQLSIDENAHIGSSTSLIKDSTLIKDDGTDNVENSLKPVGDTNKMQERNYGSTPKRHLAEPRYIPEISTPHFATPRNARRTLELIKKTDLRRIKEIMMLKQTNRRQKKQIYNLKQIIAQIKHKGFV